jgi:hypothetical protein
VEKDRLIRLEEKIDKISDKLNEINVVMAENTQSLVIHEKRTDLAEKKVELVELRLNEQIQKDHDILNKIEQKLYPIQTHIDFVNGVFKYFIPAVAAILTFLYKLDIFKF